MPTQYTGGDLYLEPEDELQPAHTHIIKKTHEERIAELEEAVRELRERRS